jgi:hypothetical protein
MKMNKASSAPHSWLGLALERLDGMGALWLGMGSYPDGSWCVVACLRLQIWGRYRRDRSGYILFQFPERSSAELAAAAAVA